MEQSILSRITGGLFDYQAWPTVAKGTDGTLYAASSGHRLGHVCPFGKNYLYISRDEGESWFGPIVANDTCLDDRDSGLCVWGDSNLLLSWFNLPPSFYAARATDPAAHNAMMRTPLAQAALQVWDTLPKEQLQPGSYVRLSKDGGTSWSEAVKVPLTSPHGPVHTPDGRLLFVGKECFWGQGLEPSSIYAMESADDGMTWSVLSQIPCPKGFGWAQIHEAHGIMLTDGTILAALRVHDSDLTGGITVYTTRSADGGKTWSEPERMVDLLGAPPHLLQHSSGAVIMVYSCRVNRKGQYARVSYDGGLTWSDDIAISPEPPTADHGYPSTVELSDGSLLTVYYQRYADDPHCSILSSRWTLPEK